MMQTKSPTRSPQSNSPTADGKFQLLLFRLGISSGSQRSELFGINVFKVREIVVAPKITKIANSPQFALGLANVRGQMIPVIDLPALTGCVPKTDSAIVLVTEFGRTTQAFFVDEVVEIVQLEWKHLVGAQGANAGLVSGYARVDGAAEDSRLAQVLDVEQILRDVFPDSHAAEEDTTGIQAISMPPGTKILFADDSHVARVLIENSLKAMQVDFVSVKNGKEAWDQINAIHLNAMAHDLKARDKIALVLTDLEMPEMDGFTLTKNIKNDSRFEGIPVIVYSSLTGTASEGHAIAVGADAYVAKFEPKELAQAIRTTLLNRGWQP